MNLDRIVLPFDLRTENRMNQMCSQITKWLIAVLIGPSWAWKDTLANELIKTWEFVRPISFTTRQPQIRTIDWIQQLEQNAKQYYFIDIDEFDYQKRNWNIFEYAECFGNYYWYTNDEMMRVLDSGKIPVCVVDELWLSQIRDSVKDFQVVWIYIYPPNISELLVRLINRQLDKKLLRERYIDAIYQLSEFEVNLMKKCDFSILNEDLYSASEALRTILLNMNCLDKTISWTVV